MFPVGWFLAPDGRPSRARPLRQQGGRADASPRPRRAVPLSSSSSPKIYRARARDKRRLQRASHEKVRSVPHSSMPKFHATKVPCGARAAAARPRTETSRMAAQRAALLQARRTPATTAMVANPPRRHGGGCAVRGLLSCVQPCLGRLQRSPRAQVPRCRAPHAAPRRACSRGACSRAGARKETPLAGPCSTAKLPPGRVCHAPARQRPAA
jgi:hypothetical protein